MYSNFYSSNERSLRKAKCRTDLLNRKIRYFFSAKRQVDSARVEDDVEVLQPPTISNTARVVPESHKEYVLGKTIDLGYVLEIYSQITDAERYRLLT